MNKAIMIFVLSLLSILVVACLPKQGPQTGAEILPENEAEPPLAETVLEPTAEEQKPVEEPVTKPIGTRLKPVAEEAPKESTSPAPGLEVISLTKQKTMSTDRKVITEGETLTWRNDNTLPHQLVVEINGVRISNGQRIKSGEAWSFTFNKLGEYLVRDLFSGDMRMLVRVEP
ncbi:hypothetical protein HZB03_05225 [Candidatus Woesearchaeota archaeon]|nr:hypothetical protein [Candidatus Woesearchaeota archaeon]